MIFTNVKDLYLMQSILGKSPLQGTERIPCDKELRGKRKLELLDIFSSIVNGDNTCTACFLDGDTMYISVNEQDDIESTKKFAEKFLSQLKTLLRNFSILESNNILNSILIRNIGTISKYITYKQAKTLVKYSNYIREKKLNSAFIDRVIKKDLIEENIFEYVREADELYDSIRVIDGDKELLLYLRKVCYIRWYYIKLVRCMKRFSKLGLTTFSSISHIFAVPCIKGISPVTITSNAGQFLTNLIDKFIGDEKSLNNTNKICMYMNMQLEDDIYDKVSNLEISDDQINMEYKGQMHAEISLVCFLLENSMNHGEIGTSKLCCAPCCMFIEMLARRNLAEFSKSGSHGKCYPSWIFPIPKQVFREDFNLIIEDITTMIFAYYIKRSITKQYVDMQTDVEIDSQTYNSDTEEFEQIVF